MNELSATSRTRMLLELWRLRGLRASKAHYDTATIQRWYDAFLTALNVATAIALVGASSTNWIIGAHVKTISVVIGVAAVLNVIASVIQYIFDFRARAFAHKHAGSEYASLNRKIEAVLASDEVDQDLLAIRSQIDNLGDASPVVSRRVWASTKEWTDRIRSFESELFPSQVEP